MEFTRIMVIAVSVLTLSGCATLTRSKYDALEIKTEPTGAQVQTSNGFSCKSTPCTIRMPRRSDLMVNITKSGCKPVAINVTHKTAPGGAAGVAGNVIFGGVIGLGVDAATGASQDLVPNPVDVKWNAGRFLGNQLVGEMVEKSHRRVFIEMLLWYINPIYWITTSKLLSL